ncbi:DUF3291 domain-containing protein [Rhizobium halophytocola]|uniref:DUF3291 domain-containing protein n=1 Tax=Rhizobium halophytocola TaxID=735519 RepID=A0ABS4DY60_9HYPH|nr:DUF3291 domain-containing protein [Rhizobium halophytocola]MBP1850616.1 hypothetical protein [Rhizobium halophytocola]
MHLAELNIATLKYPLDDPRVAPFVDALDRVNTIAERLDGFVWRLKEESGNATDIRAFDDPMTIVNLSVWRDAEALENFVWKTVHKQFYARRAEWFSIMDKQHFVLWHVEEGHRPDMQEAKQRLEALNKHGDSDHAFGWSHLPEVKLWREARCA